MFFPLLILCKNRRKWLSAFCRTLATEKPEIKVSTRLGDVLGTTLTTHKNETIYAFLGIPYAEPPVGNLRFKDPVPAKPWNGLRLAQKSPPMAPSLSFIHKTVMKGTSEDCLYLSVYTPQVPSVDQKLAVMAFIHPGFFKYGTSNIETYGPDYLVPQNIVLVMINYRLGPLGFLSLGSKECPGNYALKDQSLALRWIQENISSFGGDPNNVTIFGVSAGAVCVHYHMLSPLSKGTFQKAIKQSGSAVDRWAISKRPLREAVKLAQRLGAVSDNTSEILHTLQNASVEDILVKSSCETPDGGCQFYPTIEPLDTPSPFLTLDPIEAIKSGHMAEIPYITGITSAETIMLLPSDDYVPTYRDDHDIQNLLPKELGWTWGCPKALEAARRVREFYFPNGIDQQGYVKASSALQFSYGTWRSLRWHLHFAKTMFPVYLYIFDGGRPDSSIKVGLNLTKTKGTSHADELDHLFKITDWEGVHIRDDDPHEEQSASQKMMIKLWTDFAKTGVPSPDWPTAHDESYAVLRYELSVERGFLVEQMKFWDEIYDLLQSSS